MAPPPELNADAVSEILLRLPPDDPGDLIRASAVCKPWLQILTNPTFLRRYRDFHGTPLLLGFFHNSADGRLARYVPTMPFLSQASAAAQRTCTVKDCRHGRVLFYDYGCEEFIVWDPVTGHECRVPLPDEEPYAYSNHVVLCAMGAGCDHSACSGGPFLLACVASRCNNCGESLACFYSSETGRWSAQTSLSHPYFYSLEDRPPALVEGELYFAGHVGEFLLQYNVLGGCELSLMKLPPCNYDSAIVMKEGNGGLGLATFDDDDGMLTIWSDMGAAWSHSHNMLIDLQELLPIDIDMGSVWLSGFAEEANLIFLSTVDDGIFTIDLKSLLVTKVCEMGNVDHVFPYVSFYSPAAFGRGTLQSPMERLSDPLRSLTL